jgi:NADH:ubiquinone oxidoreductase subunit 3 (subunit A)
MADQPLFWRTLTPERVRILSLCSAAGFLAVIAGPSMLAEISPSAATLVSGIGFMIAAGALVWIDLGAPGWSIGSPGQYDERERAERHQAMAISYSIVAFLLMFVVVASDLGFARPFAAHFMQGSIFPLRLLLVFWGLPALPGIVLAWRSKRIEQTMEAKD